MERVSRWRRGLSLRSKLLAAILLIILVMDLLTLLFTKLTIYDQLKDDIISDNRQRLQQISRNISYTMSQIGEDMIEIYEDINTRMAAADNSLNQHSAFSIQFVKYYQMLTRSMRTYSYIHSMMLFTEEGEAYCQFGVNDLRLLDTDLYAKVDKTIHPEKVIDWSGLLTEDFYFRAGGGGHLVSAVMPIRKNYRTEAYFIVNLDVGQLERFLTESQEKEQVLIQLNEEDFITGDRNEDGVTVDELRELCGDFDRESFENTPGYYIFTEKIQAAQWKISMIYSNTVARRAVMSTLLLLLVLIVCSGISMIILGIFIVCEITGPINRVTRDILRSEASGQLSDISFEPKTNDEMAILVRAYNKLIARIQEHMRRIEEEQRMNNALYQMTLQMQINPHFLHNTLEALRYLVEMNDPRAMDMIVAIGDFYKFSLIGVDDVARLEEEILHIENYLRIMKIRYGNKFDYEVDIDEAYRDNVAVKLTLQPLVENAIYHGIKQKRGRGRIYIRAYREEGTDLLVEIYDNGAGISADKLEDIRRELDRKEKIERNSHIGLLNAHQRLRMHFGPAYGVRLESESGKYTIVTMALPCREYGGEREDV